MATPVMIYVVRHGATKLNNEVDTSADRIRGWSDVPLVEKGRDEARKAAEKLKDADIAAMFTSDLVRAKETALIIGKEIGLEPIVTEKLRPWNLGKFTGQPTKESLPEIAQYVREVPDKDVPEGESFDTFKERTFEGLYEAASKYPGKNILIVTHHRDERLVEAWDKAGQQLDHSIDLDTLLQKGDPPGGVRELKTTIEALRGEKMAGDQDPDDGGEEGFANIRAALAAMEKDPNSNKAGNLFRKQIEKGEVDLSDALAEFQPEQQGEDEAEVDEKEEKGGKEIKVKVKVKVPLAKAAQDSNLVRAKEAARVIGRALGLKKKAAQDRLPPGLRRAAVDVMALDRASVREIDQDGRLNVEITNISKANVCPYLGREIPGAEEMGLDPDRIYYLYRDPKELKKAASTFCNLPVLDRHIPVFAEDYREQAQRHTVGSTGSDCVFQNPFLRCSLKIWDGNAVKAIMSGEQKELSCGYHYRPDMTAGTFEGAKYDGVMRDIIGNHVALVREGRAGADVVVGDSSEVIKMKKPMTRQAAIAIGMLAPYVKSRKAADMAIDLRPVLCGLTSDDIRNRRKAVATAIKKAVKGKLAKDTSLGEIAEFLDMLKSHDEDADEPVGPEVHEAMENTAMLEPEPEPMAEEPMAGKPEAGGLEEPEAGGLEEPPGEGEESPGGEGLPEEGKEEEQPEVKDEGPEALKEFLKGKLSDEDYARAMEMIGAGAHDVEPEPEDKSGEEKLEELGAAHDNEDLGEEHAEKEEERDMVKDNPPAFKGSPRVGGKQAGDSKNFVTREEMDKTVKAAAEAARKVERDIREAERAVQPWVGQLRMSFDSAEQVYRKTLKMLGVPNVDRLHESALPTVLEMQPKPGVRKAMVTPKVAEDSVSVKGFSEMFPDADRIRLT